MFGSDSFLKHGVSHQGHFGHCGSEQSSGAVRDACVCVSARCVIIVRTLQALVDAQGEAVATPGDRILPDRRQWLNLQFSDADLSPAAVTRAAHTLFAHGSGGQGSTMAEGLEVAEAFEVERICY